MQALQAVTVPCDAQAQILSSTVPHTNQWLCAWSLPLSASPHTAADLLLATEPTHEFLPMNSLCCQHHMSDVKYCTICIHCKTCCYEVHPQLDLANHTSLVCCIGLM